MDEFPSLAESIHCFRLPQNTTASSTTLTRQKQKYTDQVKEKVLGVRRQGACLRCRMLKIECSIQNPCEACFSSAVNSNRQRKVLSFSYCVRTRFADVNIFYCESENDKMKTDTLMQKMSSLLGRIAVPASFSLFTDEKQFNRAIKEWLTSNDFVSAAGGLGQNGSIVGLCCSNLLALQFQEEDDAAGLEELTQDFQRFLLASSISHTGAYPRYHHAGGLKVKEICAAGRLSGSRLLLRLDRTLTPQYLSKLSKSSCQVLFLFVLGAVLGMGYYSTAAAAENQDEIQSRSPEFPAEMLMYTDFQQSPTLWLTMREHLCQMLAHHLIYLGGMLGIKLDTGMEKRIIESAGRGWGKSLPEDKGNGGGGYVWGDGILQGQEGGGNEVVDAKRKGKMTTSSPMMAEQPPPPPSVWDSSPKSEIEYTPFSSSHSPLVPIACGPELAHFQYRQQSASQDWDQNPASYLDMEFDEPENYYTPPSYTEGENGSGMYMEGKIMASLPRSSTEPYYNYTREQRRQGEILTIYYTVSGKVTDSNLEYGAPKEVKRRTMWIVRTVDAGPPYGEINVHARLRGGRDLEGLRSFV
ncbi:hypothetical protein QBC38DRAFT_201063 [Podospora fimiseda]|uniref:Zn(2)-C6 fungal-type domain-containing protein n=1 Tax=Podospora fimiseda TaxID=252190 RepID=A0AAN7BY09_9PEZI|nr:hypothetical protein QBC38DRAFT_201063 [Podospora fimiseda]